MRHMKSKFRVFSPTSLIAIDGFFYPADIEDYGVSNLSIYFLNDLHPSVEDSYCYSLRYKLATRW